MAEKQRGGNSPLEQVGRSLGGLGAGPTQRSDLAKARLESDRKQTTVPTDFHLPEMKPPKKQWKYRRPVWVIGVVLVLVVAAAVAWHNLTVSPMVGLTDPKQYWFEYTQSALTQPSSKFEAENVLPLFDNAHPSKRTKAAAASVRFNKDHTGVRVGTDGTQPFTWTYAPNKLMVKFKGQPAVHWGLAKVSNNLEKQKYSGFSVSVDGGGTAFYLLHKR
ncbi:hypothetical protein [Lacticaseibacillus yichunensis]|uniref:Uncharacterized protein n=1 Tax=Lacticaseibacillus yichunensis TaxID=2486015 RepID=A0ABW4CMH7_9LACO|nr:hypothetical protein [Lacticaseibacillus yichunensis]